MMKTSQRGFGMIEVLITLVVIAIGVLAHVNLQRTAFRESRLSRNLVAAAELAEVKVEDLRGYTRLNTTAGQLAYQDIASNAGGSMASGSVTQHNTTYTLNWTVVNYWYAATNSAAVTTAPSGSPSPLPSFKRVTVTVNWTDQTGAAKNFNLYTVIAAVDPAEAGQVYQ